MNDPLPEDQAKAIAWRAFLDQVFEAREGITGLIKAHIKAYLPGIPVELYDRILMDFEHPAGRTVGIGSKRFVMGDEEMIGNQPLMLTDHGEDLYAEYTSQPNYNKLALVTEVYAQYGATHLIPAFEIFLQGWERALHWRDERCDQCGHILPESEIGTWVTCSCGQRYYRNEPEEWDARHPGVV